VLGFELWQIGAVLIGLGVGAFLVFRRYLAIFLLVLVAAVMTWPLPSRDFISYSHALVAVSILGWGLWRLHNSMTAPRHVEKRASGNKVFSPTLPPKGRYNLG